MVCFLNNCKKNSKTCDGDDNNDCKSCYTENNRKLDNSDRCVCKSGYYEDGLVCKPCYPNW